jgi:hypothetical protein
MTHAIPLAVAGCCISKCATVKPEAATIGAASDAAKAKAVAGGAPPRRHQLGGLGFITLKSKTIPVATPGAAPPRARPKSPRGLGFAASPSLAARQICRVRPAA